MPVDVTSFKCIIYTNWIVPGLISLGTNEQLKAVTSRPARRVPRSLPPGTRIATKAMQPWIQMDVVKYISAFYILIVLFEQLQAIIQSIITLACSMRYMPYTTHHVYSLLKIENAAFLTYLWYTYSIVAHYTRQLQSKNCLDIDK